MHIITSEETNGEKQFATIDGSKRSAVSSCRQYVNELLDLSEDDYCMEHNIHLFQSRSGWEDAVEGWGRISPVAVFIQRKGKNKQDINSHCLLCADLKLSDLPIYCPGGHSLKTFRKTVPTLLNPGNETQNTLCSSDELHSFSLSQQNMSGPLMYKLPSNDEQCKQNKLPPLCHIIPYHTEPCQMRAALSIRSVSVLPPVRASRSLKIYSLFKRAQSTDWHQAEVSKATMPGANKSKRASVSGGTGNVVEILKNIIPGENSYNFKGPPNSKHCTQMTPTFNITLQKYELPSSTVTYTTVGRNFRQEESTRPSTRNNNRYRMYSGHKINKKIRDLKRAETHRLMLIGTRVHMPV